MILCLAPPSHEHTRTHDLHFFLPAIPHTRSRAAVCPRILPDTNCTLNDRRLSTSLLALSSLGRRRTRCWCDIDTLFYFFGGSGVRWHGPGTLPLHGPRAPLLPTKADVSHEVVAMQCSPLCLPSGENAGPSRGTVRSMASHVRGLFFWITCTGAGSACGLGRRPEMVMGLIGASAKLFCFCCCLKCCILAEYYAVFLEQISLTSSLFERGRREDAIIQPACTID
ncbi:hypothetical protein BV25DRAFT_1046960 [Artomyces pyxidatus]|uniref:Uncharacterized protein n=1 Tax=Artomyces pyxidatus TaxID=48021 RepID=A0ACB8SUA0_9AGAM|nr:hypothetical protein BV25DRAFT_1046960 [Artomyces pyxidatus]